jgi:hypothetical protein
MKQKSCPIEDLDKQKKTSSLFELIHIVQHIKEDQACQASSFSSKSPGIANMQKGKVAGTSLKKNLKKVWGNFGQKTITTRGQATNGHIIPLNVFFFEAMYSYECYKHHDYVFFEFSFGCEYRDRS